MAKTPSFRRQPVPTPAPPAGAAPPRPVAPGGGNLPLPSGQVVLTDYSRRELEKLGWREGDPIPGDLGKRIQKIQREIAQDTASATHGFPPGSRVKVGKTVNIDDLPPDRQAELREYLAEYREVMAQQEIADKARAEIDAQVTASASPSVQQAQRVALEAARAQEARQMAQVAPGAAQEPEQGPMEPGAYEVVIEGEPRPRRRRQATTQRATEASPQEGFTDEPQVQGSPAEPPSEDATGGAMPLDRCPRCWWPLSDPFEAHPTEQDRQMFVAAILGTTRFRKSTQLMGGHLTVNLRSLESRETELLFQQLGIDMRNGLITSDGVYFMRLQEYRLYMSVESITNMRGEKIIEIPPIFDIEYDEPEVGQPEQTRLVQMKEWFNNEAVTSESLRRILAQHLRMFQRLVEALEAQTDEPDFWTGIELST